MTVTNQLSMLEQSHLPETLDELPELEIGFSGTRRGMSDRQKGRVFSILARFKPARVHHGDCIGADEQFGEIAYQMHIPIVLHPPTNPALRANTQLGFMAGGIVEIRDPKEYLTRDRRIVKDTHLLIGAPLSNGKSRNGGTWYTIKYAQKLRHPFIICYTNGDMDLSHRELLGNG